MTHADPYVAFQQGMVDEHIDELLFLLPYRESLIPYSTADGRECLTLDRRIAAHVDGLLLRPDLAWNRLQVVLRGHPWPEGCWLAGIVALSTGPADRVLAWRRGLSAKSQALPLAGDVARWAVPGAGLAAALHGLSERGAADALCLALQIEFAQALDAAWQALSRRRLEQAGDERLVAAAVGHLRTHKALPLLQRCSVAASDEVRAAARCAGLFPSQVLDGAREFGRGAVELQPRQIAAYARIAGGDQDRVVELSPQECGCKPQTPPEPVRVPARSPGQVLLGAALLLAAAALVLSPVPGDEVAAGAAGLALPGL